MNKLMEYTCELEYQYVNDSTNEIHLCGKSAEYICIFCAKHFCIDDMYLLCDKCHIEIACFRCGFSIKHDKHYCLLCKSNELN